jgi:hypothetical protein
MGRAFVAEPLKTLNLARIRATNDEDHDDLLAPRISDSVIVIASTRRV